MVVDDRCARYRFDLAGTPTSLAAPTALSGKFYLDDVKHLDLYRIYLQIIRR
jgi:hypothetical protein